MYSNNILNFQLSTTILNAGTKKAGNLLKAPRIYIYASIYLSVDNSLITGNTKDTLLVNQHLGYQILPGFQYRYLVVSLSIYLSIYLIYYFWPSLSHIYISEMNTCAQNPSESYILIK